MRNRIAICRGTQTSRSLINQAALVFLLAVFALISGMPIASINTASAETRTLKLYFTHTRESATITYKKNGRYLPRGLKKLNRFLRDWRRNEPTRMDPKLFDLVWEVYRKTGATRPIQVISGYRSPKTNAALRRRGRNVARKSQHMKGRALDFFIPGATIEQIRALGLKAHVGGVGYYRGAFVHLDTGRVRHWPRMTRRQLAKVFPRGRTLHIPSDGKPMAGYQYALAKYKRRQKTGGPVLLAASELSSSKSKKGGFLKRVFGGGRDQEEDNASVRVAAKRPVKKVPKKKETRLALATTAALSARNNKGKKKSSSLPGVALADNPASKERTEKPEVAKIPVLPTRVAIPKLRPGTSPASADTDIAIAKNDTDPNAAATIVASRFSPAEPVVPALRPPLKIENSRFALAAAPELTATQKAAAALAASTPRPVLQPVAKPVFTANKPVSPDRFERQPTDETITLAMLGPARSVAIPGKNPSPSQIALGSIDMTAAPIAPSTMPTNMPAGSQEKHIDSPVTKPVLANRIERAFAALSTNLNVRPKTRPGTDKGTVRSTIPTRKSERTARASSDDHSKPKKPVSRLAASHLQLGDLEGSEVTAWAISHSTRVGYMAKLTAPRYLGILKNAPIAIFNNGFDEKRFVSRSNRFTGQAIKRIAFAKFLTTELSHNQVFPTDRY